MELGAPLTPRERPLPRDLCVSLTLTGSGNECTVLVPGHLSPHLGKNCSPLAQPALGNLLWGEGGRREGNPRRGEEALEGAQRNAVRAGPWHHRAPGSLCLASLLTTQPRMFWGALGEQPGLTSSLSAISVGLSQTSCRRKMALGSPLLGWACRAIAGEPQSDWGPGNFSKWRENPHPTCPTRGWGP